VLRVRTRSGAGIAVLVAVAIVLIVVADHREAAGRPRYTAQGSSRPNIIVINTDDQRWDTLWAMPQVRHLLAANGVTFTNSFVTTSYCCPSRSSLFTGEYSRHTGVYQNHPPNGGAPAFRDRSTIATWLHGAGYETGLIGKYLNDYAMAHGPTYIPPGWDTFDAMVSEPMTRYYNYTLNLTGTLRSFGTGAGDYSTSTEGSLAVQFVQQAWAPFFLYVAPAAPHSPAIPAPVDIGSFNNLRPFRSPAFNEANVSDKPWAGSFPRLDPTAIARVTRLRQRMLASLQAVDRMVGDLVAAVRDRGALGNTVIVFTSDNGYQWGEHRLNGKVWPYEPSIRVPLVISAPWITSPRTDSRMVLNIDMASTLADLAGATPGIHQDGRSLMPLLRGQPVHWRTAFIEEYLGGQWLAKEVPPPFEAIRTERYLYVEYRIGWRELYDLRTDPSELSNLAGHASRRHLAAALARRLHALLS
jgi:N-acetylglucosamine-6-sulfatase